MWLIGVALLAQKLDWLLYLEVALLPVFWLCAVAVSTALVAFGAGLCPPGQATLMEDTLM